MGRREHCSARPRCRSGPASLNGVYDRGGPYEIRDFTRMLRVLLPQRRRRGGTHQPGHAPAMRGTGGSPPTATLEGERAWRSPGHHESVQAPGILEPDLRVLVRLFPEHLREIRERPAEYMRSSRHAIGPRHVRLETGWSWELHSGFPCTCTDPRSGRSCADEGCEDQQEDDAEAVRGRTGLDAILLPAPDTHVCHVASFLTRCSTIRDLPRLNAAVASSLCAFWGGFVNVVLVEQRAPISCRACEWSGGPEPGMRGSSSSNSSRQTLLEVRRLWARRPPSVRP